MKLRSTSSPDSFVISVVGGTIMDLVFETERMPENGESLDASSLAYKPGGKGSNTAIAIYRAQHKKPTDETTPKPIDPPSTASTDASAESLSNSDTERHNVQVYLNTAVGSDEFGRQLKKSLQRNGVDVSGVRELSAHQSGTCAVFVDSYTKESRDIGYPGANTYWTPREQDSVECLAGGQKPILIVCHLETKKDTIETVLATATQHNVTTLLNPSPVSYIPSDQYRNITHLVLNEREAAELSPQMKPELHSLEEWKEAAKYFIGLGVENVVITVGAKGAYYATKNTDGVVEAVKNIKIKDMTGAVDTFVGYYAMDYVRQSHRGQWDIKKAVQLGCKAAAKTIEQLGAQDAIPWADEIGL